MAWNGSNGVRGNSSGNGTKRTGNIGGMMSGRMVLSLIVIFSICAVVILYCLFPKGADESSVEHPKVTRTETMPPTGSVGSVPAVQSKEEVCPLPEQKVGEERNGTIKMPDGTIHVMTKVITNNVAREKQKYAIFKHPCENVIAGLLSLKPGKSLMGTPPYRGKLTENFLKCVDEPIVISNDDSPEDRELKKAVIEAKKELKAAYDRGEDIEQIILAARQECQQLARYKKEIQMLVLKDIEKCNNGDELDVLLESANAMLEQKGIAPLNPGPITRVKLLMNEESYQ